MSALVLIPKEQIYELLEENGLILTDMKDDAHTVWYDKTSAQHYLVPEHNLYPPSVAKDLLDYILGENEVRNIGLVDQKVFKVINRESKEVS